MSFAYVRRYAPFALAFHMTVSDNAVSVRYAVLGSPSRNQIYILSLYIETHRVFDTYRISGKKLVLTLRNFGTNKRWHFNDQRVAAESALDASSDVETARRSVRAERL